MKDLNYRRIFEEATEYAIFTMDLDHLITTWNKGAEKLLGWSADEAIGQSGEIIFPDDEKQYFKDEINKVHNYGVALDERWHVKKDGSHFWASGRMMSMTNNSDDLEGYLKILLDHTENKKYEMQLQELNEKLEKRVEERTEKLISYQKDLRLLVSALNRAEERERRHLATDLHDNLGQILAVTRMELDFAQKNLPPDIDNSHINTAKDLLDEAMRYTRELMTDLKPPDDIKKELVSMIEWLVKKQKKYGLEVTIQDDHQPKPLSDDVLTAIFQSVRELFFNVIKHSGIDKANVILERQKDHVRVTVEDNGKGFNLGEMALFNNDNGGFGLFNLKERFDLLDGKVEIESGPGKGTVVSLTAPIKQ